MSNEKQDETGTVDGVDANDDYWVAFGRALARNVEARMMAVLYGGCFTGKSFPTAEHTKRHLTLDRLTRALRGDELICSSLAGNLAEEAMIRSHNDWILSQRGVR